MRHTPTCSTKLLGTRQTTFGKLICSEFVPVLHICSVCYFKARRCCVLFSKCTNLQRERSKPSVLACNYSTLIVLPPKKRFLKIGPRRVDLMTPFLVFLPRSINLDVMSRVLASCFSSSLLRSSARISSTDMLDSHSLFLEGLGTESVGPLAVLLLRMFTGAVQYLCT